MGNYNNGVFINGSNVNSNGSNVNINYNPTKSNDGTDEKAAGTAVTFLYKSGTTNSQFIQGAAVLLLIGAVATIYVRNQIMPTQINPTAPIVINVPGTVAQTPSTPQSSTTATPVAPPATLTKPLASAQDEAIRVYGLICTTQANNKVAISRYEDFKSEYYSCINSYAKPPN